MGGGESGFTGQSTKDTKGNSWCLIHPFVCLIHF